MTENYNEVLQTVAEEDSIGSRLGQFLLKGTVNVGYVAVGAGVALSAIGGLGEIFDAFSSASDKAPQLDIAMLETGAGALTTGLALWGGAAIANFKQTKALIKEAFTPKR